MGGLGVVRPALHVALMSNASGARPPCVAAIAVLLRASGAIAAEYHVAPTGDDAADGSRVHPFHSIQRAADVALGGDVVEVAPGDYAGFSIEDKRGSRQAPLVFRGAPGARITRPGPAPRRPPLDTARGTTVWPAWPNGIEVLRSWHVVVEGFAVIGMPEAVPEVQRGGAGVRLDECRWVTVRHVRADDNGRWGIFSSFCDDVVIEDNETSRSHMEHGIYLSNSGDRPVVRGNVSWGNAVAGIQINGDNDWDDAEYRRWAVPDGLVQFAVVVGNVLRDNGRGGGAALNLDGVSDSLIAENRLEDNHGFGIALFQEDGRTASQRDLIVGNTVVMAADGRAALQIVGCLAENTAEGRCVEANHPYLPSWRRPPAYATFATGNVVLFNTFIQNNPLAPAIHVDGGSLRGDGGSRAALFSDFNTLTPRLSIDGSVVDLGTWRTRTGNDRLSAAAGATAYRPG